MKCICCLKIVKERSSFPVKKYRIYSIDRRKVRQGFVDGEKKGRSAFFILLPIQNLK